MPKKKRLQVANLWKLDNAIQTLGKLPQSSPQGTLLAKLVGYNIDWLLDRHVSFENINQLFETSLNSEYPIVTWTVVALMLQMSFTKAWDPYWALDKRLRKAGITHYLGKNRESFSLALLIRLTKPLGMLSYFILMHMIRWSYGFRTQFEEQKYERQLKKWSRWRLDWITSGEVRAGGN